MIDSPVRRISARAELHNGNALVAVFNHTDALKEYSVERVGEASKFFGFGVCQKLNVKLIDRDRELEITTANHFEIAHGVGSDFVYPFPYFKVTEVHRDEKTNALSITAYDAIHEADTHTVADLELDGDQTLLGYATACARALGVPLSIGEDLQPAFALNVAQSANFEGAEGLRAVLDDIAEATQTIYYINSNWALTFKRLDKDGDAVLTIGKDKYITLESKTNRRLSAICHATELGDNVQASQEQSGTTQFVRDNAFWELREDIAEIVETALANVGGLSINQFDCAWRGNFLLEIGDKIDLVTKDDGIATAYVLNDTLTYNGAFSQQTQWSYTDNEGETASNPSTLGEALKQTYARVDKINKQIDLVASESEETAEKVASLTLTTGEIVADVIESNNELKKEVAAKMSAEDVTIAIRQELDEGAGKVVTETGYKFDANGLEVSKAGSEMTTRITDDGMKVYRDDVDVLSANNTGVDAVNLRATTYLIIGKNSRFEDYESNRTACFWIGG
jgi:hypothetical protein